MRRTTTSSSRGLAAVALLATVASTLALAAASGPTREPNGPAEPGAAQKRTCAVRGTVVWPEESPRDPDDRVKARFFGATVEQGVFEMAEWHQDVPVKEGRFEATLPNRGPASLAVYVARAEHGDFLFARAERVGCESDVVLELREAPHLVGHAVDDRGEPLRSVRITVQQGSAALPNSSMERLQRTIECDEKGAFDIALCSDGAWHVAADAEGHAPCDVAVVELPADPVRLVLPRGGTVAGRVVDGEGNGVAGLTVRALPSLAEGQLDYFGLGTRYAKTDAAGHFVLEGTAVGTIRIAVQAEAPPPAVALEVEPGQRIDDVVVTLGE